MDSGWFTQGFSNLTAGIAQAVSEVESRLDKALDAPLTAATGASANASDTTHPAKDASTMPLDYFSASLASVASSVAKAANSQGLAIHQQLQQANVLPPAASESNEASMSRDPVRVVPHPVSVAVVPHPAPVTVFPQSPVAVVPHPAPVAVVPQTNPASVAAPPALDPPVEAPAPPPPTSIPTVHPSSEPIAEPPVLEPMDDPAPDPIPLTEPQKLASVISQREQQLMAAMTANAMLSDEITEMKAQIDALEAKLTQPVSAGDAAGGASVDAVALEEFTKRLEKSEKAGNIAIRDRDKYKANLAGLQASFDDAIKQLGDREEKIKILLEEGEKLSKNELKMSTIVKKLRAKEQESETQIKDQLQKIELMTAELYDLKEKFARVTESEKRLGDSAKTNMDSLDKQAKQIVKLENELTTAKGEGNNLKAQLERARLDLQEARELSVNVNSVAHAEALEKEISANAALHKQLLDQQKHYMAIENALQKEVYELRSTLARVEDESNWKEDNLRKEIQSLHTRLQAADSRQEDLFAEARSADRPLIRQIESMQAQQLVAQQNWDQIEISLSTRLQQAERERFESIEKEKTSVERYEELNKRFTALEYQFSRERQERSRIQAELDESASRVDDSNRKASDLNATLSLLKSKHVRALEEAQESFQASLTKAIEEERRKAETSLHHERARLEKERLKLNELKQLSERAAQNNGPATTSTTSVASISTSNLQRQASTDSAVSPSVSGSSIYDSSRPLDVSGSGVAGQQQQGAVVEKLYHSLKQLQGQVASLHAQLNMVTKTRDELAEELVKATSESSDAKSNAATIRALETELAELNRRYLAALEMLGEKTEEVDDLQQNIAELRKIQKAEIEEIMRLRSPAESK
ncbi:TATA element modulatory factor 1 [Podochytrium sp. JEL0797]|nr:TATA element modulatory factor 1 [Podochytrium sp. JEL0797]KAJ3070492.1 TATA element modulatory factor 1 [Podochytrium sp. JEL0797]